ncbi:hypothetical protein [Thalassobaculum sp.]|uniref:hypothetical protein n=1 Tax=Thalassobaculum sp. TaxID=2022740 RepID=UPI0032EFAF6F
MDDGPAGHAMTEIALAMAMGFFCLMVLALVSTGTPEGDGQAPGSRTGTAARAVEALATAPAGTAAEAMRPSDRLVVFHGGRFLGADRRPLEPAILDAPAPDGGRLVLAVDPAQPMAEVLAARRRLAADELVVTPLDAAWLAVLEGGGLP